jgi:hypothetical protein
MSSGCIEDLLKGVSPQLGGQGGNTGNEGSASGGKHARLGVGESWRNGSGEGVERVFEALESGVEGGGDGPQGGSALIARRREGASRIAQEGLTSGGIGSDAPRGQKGAGGTQGEAVPADRVGQRKLISFGDGGEGQGDRERQRPAIEALGQIGGEPARQEETAFDPAGLVAEELADGGKGQAVFIDERGDDAGLVHGAGGLGRRIGGEEAGLERGARNGFDHDVELAAPFRVAGMHEALEAVDHFERPIRQGGDADRQGGERGDDVGALAPEGGEADAQSIDGDGGARGGHGAFFSPGKASS